MVREPHAPAAGPLESGLQPAIGPEDRSATGPSAPSYAGVSRRISRLTINILATAVVLILLLLLGQNLGDLWRSSTAEPTPVMNTSQVPTTGSHDGTATVEFGQGQLALMQSQVMGDSAAAAKELRRVCRAAASAATTDADRPSGEAELRLLSTLAHETPVERLDPQTELFLLAGTVPLAVVTKNGVLAADARGLDDRKVAGSRRRVVLWGIALPREKNAWTVYAFHPQGGPEHANGSLPVPPGAMPILSVRKHGESVTAFRGAQASQLDSWRVFYDRWSTEHDMKQPAQWTEHDGTWSTRFESTDGKPQEYVHIQFGPDSQGGLRGLITTLKDTAKGG